MLDLGNAPDHFDRGNWPLIETALGGKFLERSRDEWAAHFAGSDACVTPVLVPDEIWDEPQIRQRHPQASARAVPPVPRLSRTPGVAGDTDLADRGRDILTEAGLAPEDLEAALAVEEDGSTGLPI